MFRSCGIQRNIRQNNNHLSELLIHILSFLFHLLLLWSYSDSGLGFLCCLRLITAVLLYQQEAMARGAVYRLSHLSPKQVIMVDASCDEMDSNEDPSDVYIL